MFTRSVSSLLLFGFGLFLFSIVAFPVIIEDLKDIRNPAKKESLFYDELPIQSDIQDLSFISGDQILGMIPYALNGEFNLIVDGITVAQGVDINNINFSGVAGKTYRMTYTENVSTGEITITANVVY